VSSATIIPLADAALDEVVRVHLDAFRGYMNASLGPAYVRAFLDWFAGRPEAIALACLDERGAAVGYVVGAPLGYTSALSKAVLVPAARGLAMHPRLLLEMRVRRSIAWRLLGLVGRAPTSPAPTLPAPTLSLVGIGVASHVRGQGYGKALLTSFEQEARRHRAAAVRLSVYPDNAGARASYARAGWVPFEGPVSRGFAMYYSKVLS